MDASLSALLEKIQPVICAAKRRPTLVEIEQHASFYRFLYNLLFPLVLVNFCIFAPYIFNVLSAFTHIFQKRFRCRILSDHSEFIQSGLISTSSIVLTCMHALGGCRRWCRRNHADLSDLNVYVTCHSLMDDWSLLLPLFTVLHPFLSMLGRQTRTEITWDYYQTSSFQLRGPNTTLKVAFIVCSSNVIWLTWHLMQGK